MELWVKLCVKDHPDVYLLIDYDKYTICADGSVSNWLDTDFALRGWKIKAVGVMTDHIVIEIE